MRTLEPDSPQAVLPATVTVSAAARLLDICRHSAYRGAERGDLPTVRIGHRVLVPTAKLRDLLGMTDRELAARLVEAAS